jgi:hypothetical protein
MKLKKTTVVNVKKVNRIRPHFDVYIGRAVKYTEFTHNSIWHNPFKAPKDGTREEVIWKYKNYIRNKIRDRPDVYDLDTLYGKVLGCWCKPLACHGDMLIELIEYEKRSEYFNRCQECPHYRHDIVYGDEPVCIRFDDNVRALPDGPLDSCVEEWEYDPDCDDNDPFENFPTPNHQDDLKEVEINQKNQGVD